jgi:1,2-phenylacetyl-CoA epoxidase catalytic subunit
MTMPFGAYESLGAPLSPEAREHVAALLEAQGYRELIAADMLASAVHLAPSLDDRVVLAHQVCEELEHFEAVAGLYEEIEGGDLFEIVRRRLSEVPEPSSWLEAVVVQCLVCRAGRFHLRQHPWPGYLPFADIARRIVEDEEEHQAAADGVLRDLCRDSDANARDAEVHMQRWLLPTLASFHTDTRHDGESVAATEARDVKRDFLRDVRVLAATCGIEVRHVDGEGGAALASGSRGR